MPDTDADTEPAPSPLSLGERCVAWCRSMIAGSVVPRTQQLAVWFGPCERNDSRDLGRWLAEECERGKRPNHCAATQCAAAFQSKYPGETVPHRYRAAAKELMADAIRCGRWLPKELVLSGRRMPSVGDLAIYDRSTPGKPETLWQGHVDRVSALKAEGYENIGANEGPGGSWRIQVSRYDNPKLLGFVEYPDPEPLISEAYREHVAALGALTLDQAEAAWWEAARGA